MTQTAIKYIRVLWSLKLPVAVLEEADSIFHTEPKLFSVLQDPTVYKEQKHKIIDRIFSKDIKSFLKLVCDYSDMFAFKEIVEGYKAFVEKQNRSIQAVLHYVTPPTESQQEGFKNFIKNHFQGKEVVLDLVSDPDLIGGFVLQVDGMEYDRSLRKRFNELQKTLIRR